MTIATFAAALRLVNATRAAPPDFEFVVTSQVSLMYGLADIEPGPARRSGRTRMTMPTLVRRSGAVAALLAVVCLITACNPIRFTPGGGAGTGDCVSGTWKLDALNIPAPLTTPIGNLSITSSGTGVTLTLSASTWSLHADQTLSGTVSSSFGNASGSAHVVGDASGTYTSSDSSTVFTLASVSGTVDYNVTVAGQNFTGSLALPTSGLQRLYGLSGNAYSSCDVNGLSLTFRSFSMHSHH